jgi:hypothetical protein
LFFGLGLGNVGLDGWMLEVPGGGLFILMELVRSYLALNVVIMFVDDVDVSVRAPRGAYHRMIINVRATRRYALP